MHGNGLKHTAASKHFAMLSLRRSHDRLASGEIARSTALEARLREYHFQSIAPCLCKDSFRCQRCNDLNDLRNRLKSEGAAAMIKRKRTLRERADYYAYSLRRFFDSFARDAIAVAWLSGYRAGAKSRRKGK